MAQRGQEFPCSHAAGVAVLRRSAVTELSLAQMDSCIEAFGTTKQKRALNSRRMNKVGSESLNRAVAKAAEDIIDSKGVTGKQLEVGVRGCLYNQLSLLLRSSAHPTDGNDGSRAGFLVFFFFFCLLYRPNLKFSK